MEFRGLGASGLRVPALGFGTATFGGSAVPAACPVWRQRTFPSLFEKAPVQGLS